MADALKTDLRLVFGYDEVDLELGDRDIETVDGLGNLVQALRLRLLIDQGELSGLGHPRYGSRVRDLIGEPLNSANLELLRRYVRQALLQDPRVDEVTQVKVQPKDETGDVVDVRFKVIAVNGGEVQVQVDLHGH